MAVHDIWKEKRAWRARHRASLRKMAATQRVHDSTALCQVLAQAEPLQSARVITCFAPMREEPDLWPLYELWWRQGRQLAFPVVPSDSVVAFPDSALLRFFVVTAKEQLRLTRQGLWEPCPALAPEVKAEEIQAVLTPGLAFGRDGSRLGRGKAYYDRWLATLPAAALRIGVAFAWQLHDTVPHESHDQWLHAVVTDAGWHDCA